MNTPPSDLHPAEFAADAVKLGKEYGVKVEVLDEKALAKGGYGGILGVGQGSSNPPRLVRLDLHAEEGRSRTWPSSARASRSTPAACR